MVRINLIPDIRETIRLRQLKQDMFCVAAVVATVYGCFFVWVVGSV